MLNGRFRDECLGSGSFNWTVKKKIEVENYTEQDILDAGISVAAVPASHDHGHCFYDGLHGGGLGAYAAWCGGYSRRGFKKSDGEIERKAYSGDGEGKPDLIENAYAGGI